MPSGVERQAEAEIIRFLASQPTPEQIIAFHPSPEVAARAYDLIDLERARDLDETEHQELETYLYLEHFMRMLKAEAHRRQQEKRTA